MNSVKYEQVKASIQRKRHRFIETFKTNRPCDRCGIIYPPYVGDFHHRDPDLKEFTISYGSYRVSWERIVKEVEKCDYLCANCHRIIENDAG